MTTIIDNEIFGENYHVAGRYNYGAVDASHGNDTGERTVMTGLKPAKLAKEICQELKTVQHNAIESLLIAIHSGASGNSDALYLFSTNDQETYKIWFRPALAALKKYLDTKETSRKLYELQSIIRSISCGFWFAVERYKIEFKEETRFKNYTALDIGMCIHLWLESNTTEHGVNGLAGYEQQAE